MSSGRQDDAENSETASVDQEIALEQWQFYGETTLNVSNRRLKNNRFYLRLLIALLGIAGVGAKLGYLTPIGFLVIGVVGLPFCVLWSFHILSYKQLNSGKYRVMWEMAEVLPFNPFKREWTKLKEGEEPDAYIKHTTVEVWWPRVFGFFYAALSIYAVIAITENMGLLVPALTVLTVLWTVYAVMVLRGKSPSQRFWDYTGD